MVLIYRRKNKFNFSKSEWIVLFSAFLIALLIGTFMYFISVAVPEQQYMCLIVVILITILDCIIVFFMQKLNLAIGTKYVKIAVVQSTAGTATNE